MTVDGTLTIDGQLGVMGGGIVNSSEFVTDNLTTRTTDKTIPVDNVVKQVAGVIQDIDGTKLTYSITESDTNFEPKDATILKDADIGSTVEAYDVTILKDADIGVTVAGTSTVGLNDADALIASGLYRINAGATGSPDGAVGLAIAVFGNGSTVVSQIVTNKTTNVSYIRGWNGTVWTSWQTILQDGSIGTSVQAYDVDTAKTDVTQTFTKGQRGYNNGVTGGAMDMSIGNFFSITPTANLTIPNPTNMVGGQSGEIYVNATTYTISFSSYFKFAGGDVPTLSGLCILGYYVRGTTEIVISEVSDYA